MAWFEFIASNKKNMPLDKCMHGFVHAKDGKEALKAKRKDYKYVTIIRELKE